MTTRHADTALAHLADALRTRLGPRAVRMDEPLARYTAFRIGGPADLLALVDGVPALGECVTLAWDHGVSCKVLGGGSNILVSDSGVRGLVILNRARGVAITGTCAKGESGVSFSTLARQCIAQGLAGLEWAVGIPGTVGGAVVGNAGAWGGDVNSTLMQASILEPGGVIARWPVERFEYGYRSSILKRGAGAGTQQAVVLDAEFALQVGEREVLEARAKEIASQRRAVQPPGATCGSVFKNPPSDYAGRLIEAAGLKGRRIGGAEISTVHANFVLNRANATAADVKALIDLITEAVQAKFDEVLELEIELVGDW